MSEAGVLSLRVNERSENEALKKDTARAYRAYNDNLCTKNFYFCKFCTVSGHAALVSDVRSLEVGVTKVFQVPRIQHSIALSQTAPYYLWQSLLLP